MANAKTTSKSAQKAPADFESAMRELEQLIAGMENGDLPLEASLQAYQRGAVLGVALHFPVARFEGAEFGTGQP